MKELKTGTALYDELLTKYGEFFESNCTPSFGDLLWQLLANEAWKDKNLHCFVPVLSTCGGDGWMLGIAEKGDTGFYPTRVHLLTSDYDKATETLDQLNEDMFGLLPRATSEIILQSMRH